MFAKAPEYNKILRQQKILDAYNEERASANVKLEELKEKKAERQNYIEKRKEYIANTIKVFEDNEKAKVKAEQNIRKKYTPRIEELQKKINESREEKIQAIHTTRQTRADIKKRSEEEIEYLRKGLPPQKGKGSKTDTLAKIAKDYETAVQKALENVFKEQAKASLKVIKDADRKLKAGKISSAKYKEIVDPAKADIQWIKTAKDNEIASIKSRLKDDPLAYSSLVDPKEYDERKRNVEKKISDIKKLEKDEVDAEKKKFANQYGTKFEEKQTDRQKKVGELQGKQDKELKALDKKYETVLNIKVRDESVKSAKKAIEDAESQIRKLNLQMEHFKAIADRKPMYRLEDFFNSDETKKAIADAKKLSDTYRYLKDMIANAGDNKATQKLRADLAATEANIKALQKEL